MRKAVIFLLDATFVSLSSVRRASGHKERYMTDSLLYKPIVSMGLFFFFDIALPGRTRTIDSDTIQTMDQNAIQETRVI